MIQNADGTPHFAYYDQPAQLSFVWDGLAKHFDVCRGGYGEPAIDRIDVSEYGPDVNASALGWLLWFRNICMLYVETHKKVEEQS